MKILVINAGSSSLKSQLIDMTDESVLAKGICERIGFGGNIIHKIGSYTDEHEITLPTHKEAFSELVKLLSTGEHAVIKNMAEIDAVGHRVVQGAELFSTSVLVTDEVLAKLDTISDLAPLHNPANLMAIRACQRVFDASVPQVIVFDTAFHQSIPKKAYMYPIPYEMYEKYQIRRYGFHGTSHRYVSDRLAVLMNRPLEDMKVITCHLGNGSSITAIQNGKSIDTTMGFTPLDGLIMGTRCGAIDPSIVTYLEEKEGLDAKGVNDLMNKQSGFLGVSGMTSDLRDLHEAEKAGHERAALALQIQRYQIKKYIGSFAAAMGGLDVVVFTGGIGENSTFTRRHICEDMEFLGMELDRPLNKTIHGEDRELSLPTSRVKIWTIATNEELLIARDTVEIIGK
jgi:acetate kinase